MNPLYTPQAWEQLMMSVDTFAGMRRRWRGLAFFTFSFALGYAGLAGAQLYLGRWVLWSVDFVVSISAVCLLMWLAKEYRCVLAAQHMLGQMRSASTLAQLVFWTDQYHCLLLNKCVDRKCK